MQKRQALWFAVPLLLLIVTFFTLFACCCPGARPRATSSVPENASPPIGTANLAVPTEAVPARHTETQMRNVKFHIDRTAALHIHDLRGQMFDKEEGKPLNFDNPRSFIVRMFNGHVGVDGQTLTDLMNRYVFNYPGAPLKNLVVSFEDGHLVQEGFMHKIIDIPFRMIAEVSATPDGWIRIHPVKIEICNLNGEALMKAFGISLEKVMTKLPAGVRVKKNDVEIEPLAILPPPKIEGRLASVTVEGNELMQVFDDGSHPAPLQPPEPDVKNYMYFRNGTLRMGKLFMVTADMQVIDTDPSDPFDFFIEEYNAQLVAGSTRNRPDYGLTVYMRDYEDLGKPPRPGERLAP
ncbi:MAG TPA: hypothetical protein VF980_18385 [Thermoanaerobaculia bacterium]